jgi:hypothetical protein
MTEASVFYSAVETGVLLLFGFIVDLVKIHQGYCLSPKPLAKNQNPSAIPEMLRRTRNQKSPL